MLEHESSLWLWLHMLGLLFDSIKLLGGWEERLRRLLSISKLDVRRCVRICVYVYVCACVCVALLCLSQCQWRKGSVVCVRNTMISIYYGYNTIPKQSHLFLWQIAFTYLHFTFTFTLYPVSRWPMCLNSSKAQKRIEIKLFEAVRPAATCQATVSDCGLCC